jgi:DNA-directed RNA polymerase subunit M/transcription elongation factor TFIIS
MRFCDKCGSFMENTPKGYRCQKCGFELNPGIVEVAREEEPKAEPVYVVKTDDESIKVNQICPQCGHSEAYHQVRVALGEHAGVNSDRYVERFKCVACGHTWITN